MIKSPEFILIIGAFVKISKMVHETMNLTLEHRLQWNIGEWVCEVEHSLALPPFKREGVEDGGGIVPVAFSHGHQVYDEIGYVETLMVDGNLGCLGKEGPIGADRGKLFVNQRRADKKPAHDKGECDEIAALIKNTVDDVNELEGDAGMPPYLNGWQNESIRIRFLIGGGHTIQLYPFDIQAFEKDRSEGHLRDTGTYVGGLLTELQNLEQWRSYKTAHG